MNNIVVTGNDNDEVEKLNNQLGREFKIKDLGQLR